MDFSHTGRAPGTESHRLLLEQMPAVVWTADRDLRFTSSTGRGLEDLGLEPGEVVGLPVAEFVRGREEMPAGETHAAVRMHEQALEGRAGDYTIHLAGRHYQCRVEPLLDEGEVVGVVGCALDVTDRVELEREHRRAEERYRTLIELAPVAMFVDRDGVIVSANEAGVELLGAESSEELVGREVFDFVAPEFQGRVRDRIRRVEELGEPSQVQELQLRRLDGTRRIGEIRSIPVTFDEEAASLSIIRDVTDEREARRALRESERRFRSLFEDSRDAIYLSTVGGAIEEANRAFLDMFGYREEELEEVRARELYADPAERERFRRAVAEGGSVKDFEIEAERRDGSTFPCLLTATVRVDAEGEVVGYQGIARDVTEQRRIERRLEHQALHDELTDLPNRSLFWDRLEHAIARARRGEVSQRMAVLFVDLNGFKRVNDSLGHAAGDALLVEVARRLESQFREEDTVARFGGDEFVVLLEDVEDEAAVRRAAGRFLDGLWDPVSLGDADVRVSASLGVVLTEAGAPGEELDPDELVHRADAAMFRAKEEEPPGVRFFDPELDEREGSRSDLVREDRAESGGGRR